MRVACALFLLVVFSTSLSASQPTGKVFGPWHVVSINSLEGTSDDPAVTLVQDYGNDEIRLDWSSSSPEDRHIVKIRLRFDVNNCLGEDEDFDRREEYSVPGWLASSNRLENQVASIIAKWRQEARQVCAKSSNAHKIRLARLKPALREFSERLAWFAK